MSQRVVTVSALVRYLKRHVESDPVLRQILVEGEISNFSNYRSGHWYFTLKDAGAQIHCAMFSLYNSKVSFVPKDGTKVIVRGSINVYETRGELQMIVTGMNPSGIGDLYLQYEQLKKELQEGGYFDSQHKKPLVPYPFSIGLITGQNTAARKDVLSTLARRWPVAEICEYPVLVQGTQSAAQITAALKKADESDHDVILLVRGGGSIEDLWPFNDKAMALTIYGMKTPVVTGVGHETDFTIVDFVSDLRAPTPTGAAEQCAPDIRDVQNMISQSGIRLNQAIRSTLEHQRLRLKKISEHPFFTSPERIYLDRQMKLSMLAKELERLTDIRMKNEMTRASSLKGQLQSAAEHRMIQNRMRIEKAVLALRFHSPEKELRKKEELLVYHKELLLKNSVRGTQERKQELLKMIRLLDAYSPLHIMERGYSIISKNGSVLTSVDQVGIGDRINIRMKDGVVSARSEEKTKESDRNGRKAENI